jgi:hypothetical protein
MVRPAFVALSVVAAGWLATVACAPTMPQCSAANCAGCCSANGECFGGSRQTATLCGIGGAQCGPCAAGQECRASRCQLPIPDAGEPDTGVVDSGPPPACGDAGQGCCPGGECTPGNQCELGRCASCGQPGLGCCDVTNVNRSACFGLADCMGGQCVRRDAGPGACGDAGLPCCPTQPPCATRNICTTRSFCEEQCGIDGGPCCLVGASKLCDVGLECASNDRCRRADAGVDAGVRQPVGGPCQVAAECQTGLFCATQGFLSGVCTQSCNQDSACPGGSRCAQDPNDRGGRGLCLPSCTGPGLVPSTCRAGYVCDRQPLGTDGGTGVCYPQCPDISVCGQAPACDGRGFCSGTVGWACTNGAVCGVNQQCLSGYCTSVSCGSLGQPCCQGMPGVPPNVCGSGFVCRTGNCAACGTAGQPCCLNNVCNGMTVCQSSGPMMGTCQQPIAVAGIGQPCMVNAGCASGTCLQQTPGGLFQMGYCTQPCGAGGTCPGGSFCSLFAGTMTGQCFGGCTYDGGQGNCRNGYVCDRGAVPGNFVQAICVPRCQRNADCEDGLCNLLTGERTAPGFCCGSRGLSCCPGLPCPNGGLCGAIPDPLGGGSYCE